LKELADTVTAEADSLDKNPNPAVDWELQVSRQFGTKKKMKK
jgi:hypothetical protein